MNIDPRIQAAISQVQQQSQTPLGGQGAELNLLPDRLWQKTEPMAMNFPSYSQAPYNANPFTYTGMAQQMAQGQQPANFQGGGDIARLQQLYQQQFGRPGDQQGLDFWSRRMSAGMPFSQIQQRAQQSPSYGFPGGMTGMPYGSMSGYGMSPFGGLNGGGMGGGMSRSFGALSQRNMMQQMQQPMQAAPRQPQAPQQTLGQAAQGMTGQGQQFDNYRDFNRHVGAAYTDLYKSTRGGYGDPSGGVYDPAVMEAAQAKFGNSGASGRIAVRDIFNKYYGGQ